MYLSTNLVSKVAQIFLGLCCNFENSLFGQQLEKIGLIAIPKSGHSAPYMSLVISIMVLIRLPHFNIFNESFKLRGDEKHEDNH